jgi:hypothetical protein
LIDFNIIATEVAGQNMVPSLTANFGDIGPGSATVGRWLLTASLQGLFLDYQATFENLDALGNNRLALVTNVEIHEMIHTVSDTRPGADSLPDFLVNDHNSTNDVLDLPDTLYLSDGGIVPVSVVTTGGVDASPTSTRLAAQLTVNLPNGWSYVRLPEPANGQFRLAEVWRSDGVKFRSENFWTTDRTFIGMGKRPRREHILHLFDFHALAATEVYTLVYESVNSDTTPPSSAVLALAANSYAQIPVSWTGADEPAGSGLASFDVWVSVNGAPFVPWLQQTTLRGAIYTGGQGGAYAFYSVATDLAGNREAAPASPDAQTLVNLTNTPPTLLVGTNLVADEGDTVVLENRASDPEAPPQTLTFSLGPGGPPGGTIEPFTGRITWPTGEGNGPSTNVFTVIVQDNGLPALSATGQVTVILREVNQPPWLAALESRTINEGFSLVVSLTAGDDDLPRNALRFSLGTNAPRGATLAAETGLFRWRPSATQGPSTNLIPVIVTDDGAPSLSATQLWTVIVRDVLSDFTLSVGSTNVWVGETNAVPWVLRTGVELSSLSFILETDSNRLGGLAWVDPAPGLAASLRPVGTNRWQVSLAAGAGQPLQGTVLAGRLQFTALSNEHSAVVPLRLSELRGSAVSGQFLVNGGATNGRVIVVATEPVLEAGWGPGGARELTLYGLLGERYSIQSATRLAPPIAWQNVTDLVATNRQQRVTGLAAIGPHGFYRVGTEAGAGYGLRLRMEHGLAVLEWPIAGQRCRLEETASLHPPIRWNTVTAPRQTDATRVRVTLPVSGPRFFRLVCE